MVPYRCEGARIFKCPTCHGLWLSAGRKLGLFRSALERFKYQDFEVYLREEDAYVVSNCARCRQVLDEFNYGYNSGVRLYRCARCGGMWMPLKELIRLMQSLKLGQSVREDVRARLKEIRRLSDEQPFLSQVARTLRFLVS